MRRVLAWALALSFAVVVAVFLNNTTLLAPPGSGRPTLLTHRGLVQTYHREGLTDTTCTAARIDPLSTVSTHTCSRSSAKASNSGVASNLPR